MDAFINGIPMNNQVFSVLSSGFGNPATIRQWDFIEFGNHCGAVLLVAIRQLPDCRMFDMVNLKNPAALA
jgi:hypothetical protein